MITPIFWQLLLVLGLIALGGLLTAVELALQAARRGALQARASTGNRGAQVALDLATDGRLMPTLRLLITLAGAIAASIVVLEFAEVLAQWSTRFPGQDGNPVPEALAVLTGLVCYVFIAVLFGQMIPQRLAERYSSQLAAAAAWPVRVMVSLATPVAWLLRATSEPVLRLLDGKPSTGTEQGLSLEEIEQLIETGASGGLLDPSEHRVALEALRLGDRTVREIMLPRLEIDGLEINTPAEQVLGAVALAGFSRLPIYEDNLDQIVGYIHIKDILRRNYLGLPLDLKGAMRKVLFVPETLSVDRLLERFQQQRIHLAIVLDEFGGTEGMVTLENVLELLVGEMHDEHHEPEEPEAVEETPGQWLVDGGLHVEDLLELVHAADQKLPAERNFSTLAGLTLVQLGHIPKLGDRFQWRELSVEVVQMDGPRLERLRVWRPSPHEINGQG